MPPPEGVRGSIQIGTAATGEYTSGVQAVTFDSERLADVVEVRARLTSDDKAIGVQANSSFMGPGGPLWPAQLYLTDPKPKHRRE